MLGNDPLGDAAAWRGQPGAQRSAVPRWIPGVPQGHPGNAPAAAWRRLRDHRPIQDVALFPVHFMLVAAMNPW